jgi:pyrroline-5-carboxylate reductase
MSERSCGKRLAFLGAGQMAEALIGGLLSAGLCEPDAVMATDVSPARLNLMKQRFGIRAAAENREAAGWGQVVVLAVKPQVIDSVLADVRAAWRDPLVVSIAAGVPIQRLAAGLPAGARLVRVMPNAPALVGAGMSAFTLGPGVTEDETRLVTTLFESVGRAVRVDESQMNAVTGLSGSGPAYVCVAIEAMADGGVKMGLPRTVAEQLAVQTVLGAARMLIETGEHPAKLKDRVASPGGTTIAGLHQLEAGGARTALIAAVEAATKRSEELGR